MPKWHKIPDGPPKRPQVAPASVIPTVLHDPLQAQKRLDVAVAWEEDEIIMQKRRLDGVDNDPSPAERGLKSVDGEKAAKKVQKPQK